MSKVITFSTQFPPFHLRKGNPTYFIEKIINWYWTRSKNPYNNYKEMFEHVNGEKFTSHYLSQFIAYHISTNITSVKSHTIRRGNRWKKGETFSPRIWTGAPYQSQQLSILPDLEIKNVCDIYIDKKGMIKINGKLIDKETTFKKLAVNDGLGAWQDVFFMDFYGWLVFPCIEKGKSFDGQIICWDEKINY